MVAQFINEGVILSACGRRTSALDELVVTCGWPAVLEATPGRLRRELSLGIPKVSLIWLDDYRELAATVRLLDWLKESHPSVRRLVVAYCLAADYVEPAIRSAGVHFFLAIDGQIRAMAQGVCSQWRPRVAHLAPEIVPQQRPRVIPQELTSRSCVDRSLRPPP